MEFVSNHCRLLNRPKAVDEDVHLILHWDTCKHMIATLSEEYSHGHHLCVQNKSCVLFSESPKCKTNTLKCENILRFTECNNLKP